MSSSQTILQKKQLSVVVVAMGIGFLIIAACMVYLLKTGISLTPAVLIKPSSYTDTNTVVEATVQRLFPQFSENKYWQLLSTSSEARSVVEALAASIKSAHPKVEFKTHDPSHSDLSLTPNKELKLYVQTFSKGELALSKTCHSMKRLNYDCFVEVSLHKSRRKIKDSATKYFFLTSYLDTHYLLLIEQ